jgi:hypothetical protein
MWTRLQLSPLFDDDEDEDEDDSDDDNNDDNNDDEDIGSDGLTCAVMLLLYSLACLDQRSFTIIHCYDAVAGDEEIGHDGDDSFTLG